MHRIIDRAVNALMVALGLILLGMIVLSVYNVVSRYVFNNSLLWADEIAVFAMIILAWLGAIVSAWRGDEIRMDLIARMLPARLQLPLLIIQEVLIAGLLAWVSWLSYGYTARVFQFGMRSDSFGIPVWLVHAVLPLSLGAIALIAVSRLIRALSGRPEVVETLVQKEFHE